MKIFYCGSPMNSQNDLIHAANAVKQHNVHNSNIRASHVSSLLKCGLNASMAHDRSFIEKKKGVSAQATVTFHGSFDTSCLKFKFMNNIIASSCF